MNPSSDIKPAEPLTDSLSGENRNVPTVKDALAVFIVVLIISLILSIFVGVLPKKPLQFLYAVLLTHVIGIVIPLYLYIRIKGYNLKETLNLKQVPASQLLVISFVAIIFFMALNMLQNMLNPIFSPYEKEMAEYQNFFLTVVSASKSTVDIIILVITVSIIPAIAEEFLFRGFILNGLKNSSNAAKAIILSGLLFGIIHSFPPQVLMVSMLGIFLGWLVIRTGSIVTAIWCHFLNNFLMVMIMVSYANQ